VNTRSGSAFVAAAWAFCAAVGLLAAGTAEGQVTVREQAGIYTVDATFNVSQPASRALATLTDYEQIPRFMPEVQTSRVLERGGDRAVVEQDALARFMMFSKSVHLVLEVEQGPAAVRFRDLSGQSFSSYEGAWVFTERDGYTAIRYQLSARPAFDVPDFLLKRLLKRDATRMIERLQREIAARAQ
jgi:ribosome-associated toxin RatA of RatAB toxin-antitoxin module